MTGGVKGKTDASWLDGRCASKFMDSATAQVTPLELTRKLMQAAVDSGAELVTGIVNGISIVEGKVVGVSLQDDEELIPADKVVLCAGPWSGVMAEDFLGLHLPMDGVKSTSLIYKAGEVVKAEPFACFCEEDDFGCHLEIYPRSTGELCTITLFYPVKIRIYLLVFVIDICGCGESDYVSGDRLRKGGDCEAPELIDADTSRVQAASASFRSMTSLGNTAPDVIQACMRPCTPDGLPVMGAVEGIEGAYLSCGHNCWGILWAPISGKAMAELIVTGSASSVDLRPFKPGRFMSKARRGRKKGMMEVGEQW